LARRTNWEYDGKELSAIIEYWLSKNTLKGKFNTDEVPCHQPDSEIFNNNIYIWRRSGGARLNYVETSKSIGINDGV
jgi:hypothetical protein